MGARGCGGCEGGDEGVDAGMVGDGFGEEVEGGNEAVVGEVVGEVGEEEVEEKEGGSRRDVGEKHHVIDLFHGGHANLRRVSSIWGTLPIIVS